MPAPAHYRRSQRVKAPVPLTLAPAHQGFAPAWCELRRDSQELVGGGSTRSPTQKGTAMKVLLIGLLFILAMAYLALCAYGIARTGSAAGLAEIGNAAVLAIVLGSLAVVLKK